MPTDIPERVSSNSEAFTTEEASSIFSTRSLYATDLQFTRFDIWYSDPLSGTTWEHSTEIHDFATDLSYQ